MFQPLVQVLSSAWLDHCSGWRCNKLNTESWMPLLVSPNGRWWVKHGWETTWSHCTQSWSPVLHRYGPDKVQCGQQSSPSHKAGFLLCSQWQSIFHTPPLPLSYCQQYCCQHGLAHLQDTLLWLAPVCMCLCSLYFPTLTAGYPAFTQCLSSNMKYMPPVDNTCLFVVLLSDVQCAHLQNS